MRSEETDARTRFAALVTEAAQRAGYDIKGRGGKAALARDTGMAESSVGRMLAGKILPDPKYFEPLAAALKISVFELLVESEIISPESLETGTRGVRPGVRSPSVTVEEAAESVGINDPVGKEMFAAMVERLRRDRASDSSEDGGAAAQM